MVRTQAMEKQKPHRSIGLDDKLSWQSAEILPFRQQKRLKIPMDLEGEGDGYDPSMPAYQVKLMSAVASNQDKAAFGILFRYFAPRLHSFSLRLGCQPERADDLVQDAMSKVWRKAAQFDSEKAAVSTWIFTITRNLFIDNMRRQNRPAPDPNDPAMTPNAEPTPIENISKVQEADRLRQAVLTLKPEQRQIIEMAFFQEKSHASIAEELDMPLGTVKSRIRLALKHVRRLIGDVR
jgi:RNA polymerase sigma-70 factor (ECF subfamily)